MARGDVGEADTEPLVQPLAELAGELGDRREIAHRPLVERLIDLFGAERPVDHRRERSDELLAGEAEQVRTWIGRRRLGSDFSR